MARRRDFRIGEDSIVWSSGGSAMEALKEFCVEVSPVSALELTDKRRFAAIKNFQDSNICDCCNLSDSTSLRRACVNEVRGPLSTLTVVSSLHMDTYLPFSRWSWTTIPVASGRLRTYTLQYVSAPYGLLTASLLPNTDARVSSTGFVLSLLPRVIKQI